MKGFLIRGAALTILIVALLIILPNYVQAATIRVEAFVDGRSQLIISGHTAQWRHFVWTAPGDPDSANYPTTINYVEWFPAWTGTTTNCGGCDSDSFNAVCPGMSAVTQTVTINTIQSRDGTPTISQQPSAANSYTLIVEFDDTSGGAFWYIIELNFPSADPCASSAACYEVTYTNVDNPTDTMTLPATIELDYGLNTGRVCSPLGNLTASLFFDPMREQALGYNNNCWGYIKFHGDNQHVLNGISYCDGGRYTVRGHKTDAACPACVD